MDPPNYLVALLSDIRSGVHWLWDQLFLRLLVGYGYRPENSLIALVFLWLLASGLAQTTWHAGAFAPASGPVLLSEDWQNYALSDPPANPAALWSQSGRVGRDWESFNAFAYGADLVIPLIDFGQTSAWAPSTTRGDLGWILWSSSWFFILAGWIVTALGAAAITGIIRRD
jgi:hypothetical protein